MVGTPMITTCVKRTLSQPIGARELGTGCRRAGASPPPEVGGRRSASGDATSGGRAVYEPALPAAAPSALARLFRGWATWGLLGSGGTGSCVPLVAADGGLERKRHTNCPRRRGSRGGGIVARRATRPAGERSRKAHPLAEA